MGLNIFVVFISTAVLSSVCAENMFWGQHPNLVDETNKIQGRENNKRAVVMHGESITLECTVTSTSDPPNNIIWKIDGKAIDPDEKQKQEKSEGVVDIQGHLTLKITKEMDDKTVTCEYSKDRFGDHIEAKLRVFSLEIETSEDVCNKCEGDENIVFKESKQESPAETTVDMRIKEKIKELVDREVTANISGYFVSAPISIIKKENHLSPKIFAGDKQLFDCCAKAEPGTETKTGGGGSALYGLIVIPVLIILGVIVWVSPLRGGSCDWRLNSDIGDRSLPDPTKLLSGK